MVQTFSSTEVTFPVDHSNGSLLTFKEEMTGTNTGKCNVIEGKFVCKSFIPDAMPTILGR